MTESLALLSVFGFTHSWSDVFLCYHRRIQLRYLPFMVNSMYTNLFQV